MIRIFVCLFAIVFLFSCNNNNSSNQSAKQTDSSNCNSNQVSLTNTEAFALIRNYDKANLPDSVKNIRYVQIDYCLMKNMINGNCLAVRFWIGADTTGGKVKTVCIVQVKSKQSKFTYYKLTEFNATATAGDTNTFCPPPDTPPCDQSIEGW